MSAELPGFLAAGAKIAACRCLWLGLQTLCSALCKAESPCSRARAAASCCWQRALTGCTPASAAAVAFLTCREQAAVFSSPAGLPSCLRPAAKLAGRSSSLAAALMLQRDHSQQQQITAKVLMATCPLSFAAGCGALETSTRKPLSEEGLFGCISRRRPEAGRTQGACKFSRTAVLLYLEIAGASRHTDASHMAASAHPKHTGSVQPEVRLLRDLGLLPAPKPRRASDQAPRQRAEEHARLLDSSPGPSSSGSSSSGTDSYTSSNSGQPALTSAVLRLLGLRLPGGS